MTRAEELRAASDKAAIELRLVECKLIGMSRCVAGLWKTKAPGLDFALGALAAVSVQQQTAQDALLAALEAETAAREMRQ